MKTLKLLFATLVIGISISSCSVIIDDYDEPYYETLEDVVTSYDLWYIDYNKTSGNGDVPFLSKAFTISFINGKIFANNNLVGIGTAGNGYGIQIGYYNTFEGYLEIDHNLDGYYDFDVIQISNDRIKLKDNYNNVTYYLEGYQKYNFDYDQIFYDNIEYFLQEYNAWEKTFTSQVGALNEFDNENFLSFTPENLTTFYSSQDEIGTNIANLYWDYVGDYTVANVQGYDNLKILTLDYDSWGNEEFELTVINDSEISLYHIDSGTTYEFKGKGYIQYLKTSSAKGSVRNDGRKRTKVNRETKVRRNLK
ncbi:hypothetical protein [Lutibacter flavus]|uniref:Nicotinic acid mononucleotide adenyltransferase n=1 Tax=Lutibacter flavus TaxID=691689 RepID=A0A238X261_9FLAO|nr:hypothetical protein [Lutibacter flavus]SNR52947.1 hypothetical protein SAMN04488111_1495 [Lutibacter flavus]